MRSPSWASYFLIHIVYLAWRRGRRFLPPG
jgi:hypothetical protein